jgi:polypeptide N-acetylgalactosaminyltransferase
VLEKYPPLPPNQHWGELKNAASGACLDTFGRHPPEAAGASSCHGYGGNQLMRLNTEGQMTSGEWCLKAESSDQVVVAWCEMGTVDGPWQYLEEEHQLYHKTMKKCLALHPESNKLMLRDCDKSNTYHKWNWSIITPYWAKNSAQ